MSDVDAIRDELEAALAGLVAALTGIAPDLFEAPGDDGSLRDRLWQTGLFEDWTRRAVDQGAGGRAVDAFHDRERPAIAQTPEYLVTWLEQCRRPTLALLRRLRRLPDDALDREFVLSSSGLATGEWATARHLLSALLTRLVEDTAQVRRIREGRKS